MPSRSVDLPEPFSPTKKVTGTFTSSWGSARIWGTENGYGASASGTGCFRERRSRWGTARPSYPVGGGRAPSCSSSSPSPVDVAARPALFSPFQRSPTNMAKPTTSKKNKPLSKSEILKAVIDANGEDVSGKQVKAIIEALVAVGHKELKKSGVFVLPGFAKFVVVKKPARPAREGINPFTKEKQMFAAKPASKAVKARPVKAIKDAVT